MVRYTGIGLINLIVNIFGDEDFLATDTAATDVVNADLPNEQENLQTQPNISTTIQSTVSQ